ncbi:MAG: endopeptidase La [Clostridia bacterium]|nr:endopeptidase La [Clostridia bacterium]
MEDKIMIVPVIPLRGLAVLPGEIIHCDIGRPKTIGAMQHALEKDGLAFLTCQEDPKKTEITPDDFSPFGTLCKIKQVFRVQGDSVHLLVTGLSRAMIREIVSTDSFFAARIEKLSESEPEPAVAEALRRKLTEAFATYTEEKNRLTKEQREAIGRISSFPAFTDAVAQCCLTRVSDKQVMVETADAEDRAIRLLTFLGEELEVVRAEAKISEKVKEAVARNQKEFVLREQLRAVKEELGDTEDSKAEVYRARMEEKSFPEEVRVKLEKEIDRYADLPRGSHEMPMAEAYIELILDLPWTEATEDNLDLVHAREVLDRDHYGMEKIKDRIVEMLAVCKLTGNAQGQIVCLVGPPGVGKTSIAKAVAEAMGRKYVRMSLGGVHDESEIRGHRRTYIGAEPGRIIDAMRKAKTVNPLLLFDEIDKLSNDIHGDPAAAMLEVLDSAQNNTFADHFLELPYDLSKCMMMTTANDASAIPQPLLDRMEVIEVPSYLFDEKLEIAKRHLLPKQLQKHGLSKTNLRVNENVLRELIEGYTREAGVRSLERTLATVARKTACEVVNGKQRTTLSLKLLTEWLGPKKFRPDEDAGEERIGVVNGLAWTSVGGTMLEVEASVLPGKGVLQLTGQLGDVMQESARAALTWIRANAADLGIDDGLFEKTDIHIHVPEGAVPKDGPSAGITMVTALASVLTGIPVRARLAMTGEVTLRGRVLPIGGLREKLLAAVRAGITTVLIPEKNKESLYEVPDSVKDALEIRFVRTADEVLAYALAELPAPHPVMRKEDKHAAVCH